ncbi:MAG TPA: hypothetical protein VFZ35_00895 [Sphingomicrobium sp.]
MGGFPYKLVQLGDGLAHLGAQFFVLAVDLLPAGKGALDPCEGSFGSIKRN